MSANSELEMRLNRRQLLVMGGAACLCGSTGATAFAATEDLTSQLIANKRFFCTSRGPITFEDHEKTLRSLSVQRPDLRVRALKKSPAPRKPAATPGDNRPSVPRKFQLAIATNLKWTQKSTVTYAFIDGDIDDLQQHIKVAFDTWQPHTGLKFVLGNPRTANIRIGFRNEGYWSYIGIESTHLSDGPTLNIQPGNQNEYQRATLHEVGHALGLIHEHQAPSAAQIPWDVPALNAYYRAHFNWSPQDVQDQVLNLYRETVTNTKFDKRSIMLYVIPREVLRADADPEIVELVTNDEFNNVLSPTDKSAMEQFYGLRTLVESDDDESQESSDGVSRKPKLDREKLKADDALELGVNKVKTGEFPSDLNLRLYKFRLESGGHYVLETVDGPRRDKAASGGMPVVIELFDGTDFAASKALEVSKFGAARNGTQSGSLGASDAFLKFKLDSDKTYYALVRPLQRLPSGATKTAYSLLLRQAAAGRPNGLDDGSWDDLTDKLDTLSELQKTIADLQKELRK